ncbi:preprotein translocase, YajC subunit [Desulfarculus baarsii DSM 2075]|uniref:Sec translocon accessory complex subunit YajC n=1 Tax=Desulfarculus baarsii (strain ATCC 33931 / DSM 2075 / LMG 7858 / VKM B-1802 / 2st14) TaxID=644282 RepID=E1QIL7_DESB2|nr:preprotein translocase subunit YajC [Desulfarculus baarsii]ADK84440.1 preprotein translocase, YajC subunit [Desulfarculus baarsii DSM 2075]
MLDLLFATNAMAQEAAGGAAPSGIAGMLTGPLPMLVLMFVVFYFLLIRPQQKKTKAHREMLGNLKAGDQIVTSGGIFGRITGLTDQTVVVEIAPQVRIKVQRGAVAGLAGGQPAPAEASAKGKKK